MGEDVFFAGGEIVFVGVVAGGVGFEPFGMLEHPVALDDDFGLDLEVAFLAEGWDVPPFAVGRI